MLGKPPATKHTDPAKAAHVTHQPNSATLTSSAQKRNPSFAKSGLETIQSQTSCPRFRRTTTLRTKHVEIDRCKSAQRDLSCHGKRFSMLLVVSRTSMQPPRLLCWCHRIKWSMGKSCVGRKMLLYWPPLSPSKGLMATHWLARFQRMASPTVALEAISLKVGFPESVAA